MFRKTTFSIIFVIIILSTMAIGWIFWSNGEDAPLQAKIIAPDTTVTQGDNFTVDISAEQVDNLNRFQLDVLFNPKVLEFFFIREGDILRKDGGQTSFLIPTIDNNTGLIVFVITRTSPGGVSGNGVLIKITFRAKNIGESMLVLQNIKLRNASGEEIPFLLTNGTIRVIPKKEDVNKDGKVDISDLVLVGKHFGQVPPTDERADVNKDGKVDISDLVLVSLHF